MQALIALILLAQQDFTGPRWEEELPVAAPQHEAQTQPTETKSEPQPQPKTIKRESKKIGGGPADAQPIGMLVVWTILVFVLLGGFFVILRRLMRRPGGLFQPGVINVLARRRLSMAHEIYLVEVGSKLFLIGTTKEGIQALGQLTDPQEVAILRAKFGQGGEGGALKTFEDSLKAELKEGERTDPDAGRAQEGIMDALKEIKSMVTGWKEVHG